MPAPSTPAPIDDVISARFTLLVNGAPRAVTFVSTRRSRWSSSPPRIPISVVW